MLSVIPSGKYLKAGTRKEPEQIPPVIKVRFQIGTIILIMHFV